MHDFKTSLQMSHAAEDLPCWEQIYREFFPGMKAMVNHRQDGWHQRQGIDRSITLHNSKQILIDEKARGRSYQGDILLEYISCDRDNSPGWVEKSLMADYICVAYLHSGHALLLPVIQLQMAWQANKDKWLKQFKLPPAKNRGYNTLNVAVPERILFSAIGGKLRCRFTPTNY